MRATVRQQQLVVINIRSAFTQDEVARAGGFGSEIWYTRRMYLCIDVGGTKTLCAVFTEAGELVESRKFKTPPIYKEFVALLGEEITALQHRNFKACAIAVPGRVDRKTGTGLGFGNLDWKDVPIGKDVKKLTGLKPVVENDANAAGLSEARLLGSKHSRVLYITVSTGIGGGFVLDGQLDPDMLDYEPGHMMLEYDGKLQKWEKFASGKAIVARFGKPASEIQSQATWTIIAHNIAYGLIDQIVVLHPDIIVIGGGVGAHFEHFGRLINDELRSYQSNIIDIPPVVEAKRAEEAVIYGCYELAKQA